MSDEHKVSGDAKALVMIIWSVLLFCISLTWAIAWYGHSVVLSAFENGYSEQSLPGVQNPRWVKLNEGQDHAADSKD